MRSDIYKESADRYTWSLSVSTY